MHRRHQPTSLSIAAIVSFLALPAATAQADSPPPPPFVAGQTDFGGAPTLASSSSQGVPSSLAGVDLSTGEAKASFSFDLPTARGDAQATLGLTYSSAAGVGFAGMGWTLDLPSIERRGAAGAPRFDSDVLGTLGPDQSADRYVFGGLPLVPICTLVDGGICINRHIDPQEAFPVGLAGWTYFRAEVDNGERFFYSPTGLTWIVQNKRGVTSTFGALAEPLVGGATAIERGHDPLAPMPPGGPAVLTAPLYPVYRWNLAKQSDASGNAVYYAWSHLQVDPVSGVDPTLDQGREYLTDIYDTSGSGSGVLNGGSAASFAHHVHLQWNVDGGSSNFLAQSPSWQTPPAWFLDHLDVTSSPLSGGVRQLVRRYWLHYGPFGTDFSSFQLAEVDLEGTCNAWAEDSAGLLPSSTGCPRLPALAMTYTASRPALTATHLLYPYLGPNVPQPPYYLVDYKGVAVPSIIDSTGLNIIPNPNNQGTLAATPSDLLPGVGVSRFALGDWLSDGQVDWIWFNIAPSDQPANANQYEVYSHVGTGWMGNGPFALPSYLGQPSQGPHGFQPDFQTGRAMDVDGDGLTDMGVVPEGAINGTSLRGYFSTRDALGQIHPVAQWSSMPTCGSDSLWGFLGTGGNPGSFYAGAAQRILADVDGDGLADLVVLENVQPFVNDQTSVFGEAVAHVFKNRGDGRFGSGGTDTPAGCNANFAYDSYDIPIGTGNGIDNQTFVSPGTSMHDVNGDGLADFVWIDVNGLHVILQQWDPSLGSYQFDGIHPLLASLMTLGCTSEGTLTGGPPPPYNVNDVLVEFADMDASGVDDIVTFVCGTLSWFSLDSGAGMNPPFPVRPGLLQSISNGVGLSTTLTYENFKDVFPTPTYASPSAPAVPVPLQLVAKVETTNGLQGPASLDSTTSYSYQSPVYDARDRVFVGFQTVTTSQAGDSSGPGLDTVTHFANGTCAAVPGQGCPPTADYGYRLQRGLPAVIEQRMDGTPTTESTTVNVYGYETLYAGTDGRIVRQVYLAQVDQYLWDEKQQQFASSSPTVLVDVSPSAAHLYDLPITINLPTAAGHTRKRFHLTAQGNEDWVVDYGNPDGPSRDQPIRVNSTWIVPANSETSWNYRLSQTLTAYADGSGNLVPPVREADFTYDYRGLPATLAAPLAGSLPLLRANPGGQTALTPKDASQDTNVPMTLLTLSYGPLGNLIQVTGPGAAGVTQQCTKIDYDGVFAQLPVAVTQFRGGCGGEPFTTLRAYNRGFERVTMEISPSREVFEATYDAFGRLQTARAPNASTPLQSDSEPTLKVDYVKFDPPPPPLSPTSPPAALPPFPVRVLGVQSNIGLPGQPSYEARWRYLDGGGRQLLTVQQSEGAGQVVVQGLVAVGGSTGRVTQAWRPFFAALGDGSAYAVQGPAPAGKPVSSVTYNALSEIVSSTDELGRVSQVAYLPTVFSRRVMDAAQVAKAHNASTTIQYDGHGRLSNTTATIAVPQTDSIVTALTYLATGEVTTVTKTDSASTARYVRSMQYDTRGRLVSNTEPNTSFTPVVQSGGVDTTPHDWRYAYNNSGQLVGTSDARGCGENMQYDDLGRIVGEDYSPCTGAAQPAYTTGNYLTGEGLEAFYKYDVPETSFTHPAFYRGRLTAVYDRGENTRFQLDGRGRVTELDRRLGGVTSFEGVVGQYAPHVFKRQFAYDEANRVLTATTGADVPELMSTTGSTMTTTYAVRGGVSAVQMPYSGGQLLARRTFDASNNPLNESYGSSPTLGLTQAFTYYPNETLEELVTDGPLQLGKGGVSQTVIQDLMLSYDQVDNPTAVNDVSPTAWPAGILPAKHAAVYDDLYRLTSATTTYGTSNGSDAFSLPYQAEVMAGSHAFPATVVPQKQPARVGNQTFAYDFLDNVQTSTDDQNDAPDRSFGQAQYGSNSVFRPVPNHFISSSENGAAVTASYDQAGNTTGMTVTYATLPGGGCSNGAAPPCVSTYVYDWDEVGRLLYSVRYDGAVDPGGGIVPQAAVEFAYTYDASGARVARYESAAQDEGRPSKSYSVTVFPSLRLETPGFDSAGDYELNGETEIVYLQDGAGVTYGRAFYAPSGGPSGTGTVHVYLEFGDHLGSTTAVVDFDSGAVVEKSSYLAFGAVDADYRPEGFREPYRYTGHHDDSEVGLTYFGARYYIPTLARWASPDPLTIHGLGSSLNPYSFVGGAPLGNVDPFGLDEGDVNSGNQSSITLTFSFTFGGGFSGNGPTFAGGATPPPPPPFTFQQWNPAASGTFQLQQPGASPSWAIASALRTHTGAEAWKGLANVGIDLLASTLQFTLKSGVYGFFVNIDALIPRFRLDPHDDGQVVRDIGNFTLGAAMVVGTDGLSGAEAIAGEALDVAGAKVAERLVGAAEGGAARTAATGAVNVLPSSGRIFVGTPGGQTVAIPAGWVGRVADSGSGLVFQEVGAAGNANMIRIMDATPSAPSGYVRFYNRYGQPLDVLGQPGGRAATHIPLDFQGQIEWPW